MQSHLMIEPVEPVDPVLVQRTLDIYNAAIAAREEAYRAVTEFWKERNRLKEEYLQKKTASDADPSNQALVAATAEAHDLYIVVEEEHGKMGLDLQIKYTSEGRARSHYACVSRIPMICYLYRECTRWSCLCPRTSNGEISCIHYSSD